MGVYDGRPTGAAPVDAAQERVRLDGRGNPLIQFFAF